MPEHGERRCLGSLFNGSHSNDIANSRCSCGAGKLLSDFPSEALSSKQNEHHTGRRTKTVKRNQRVKLPFRRGITSGRENGTFLVTVWHIHSLQCRSCSIWCGESIKATRSRERATSGSPSSTPPLELEYLFGPCS